jgi:hypothetical protein
MLAMHWRKNIKDALAARSLEREKLCHIGVEDIFGNWLTQMSL